MPAWPARNRFVLPAGLYETAASRIRIGYSVPDFRPVCLASA
jgi:hypothetical protein